jgi:putative MATE family efflux protein
MVAAMSQEISSPTTAPVPISLAGRPARRERDEAAQDRKKVEHELGEESVGRLLVRYSLPAIVASTVASLYNIVDRIFIGQGVGPYAISGLAITLPIVNLAIAFGAMVGVGASALTSIRLGEGRPEEAERILGTTVVLNAILGTAYSLCMLLFLDPLLRSFGASDETLPYAREFLHVILVGSPFFHSYMGLNSIMRSSGHPRKAMVTTILTVAVNLALAPIFIFVFHWGIRGAALATVAGQLTGLGYTVAHFGNRHRSLRFRVGIFSVDFAIVRGIFSIGMSAFFMQAGASLVAVILNLQLVRHGGDFGVGAFGIINSVLMVVAMVVIGIGQGMQPIVGFNYGARRFGRVMRTLRHAIIGASLVTCAGFLVSEIFPWQVACAFTRDPYLRSMSVQGMRLCCLIFPLAGFQIITAHFFQSIGRAKLSVILSLSRQIGFLIPFLFLLPALFGLVGVWLSLAASDFVSAALTWGVLRYERKRIEGLDAPEEG